MPNRFAFWRNATFASLLVGYAGYYLCRQNLSAAKEPLRLGAGVDIQSFGNIVTFGTLLYAAGKLTTGSLGDARGRLVFFVGLAGAVVASLLFGLGSSVWYFGAVWGVNRFFQSMGWGGLVSVLSRWFPKSSYGTAMGVMSMSYQLGGALALAFTGALIRAGFDWKALFWIPGLVLAAIGLAIAPLLKARPSDVGLEELPDETPAAKDEPESTYLSRLRTVASDRTFWVMCGLSFVLTLLRDIFQFWTPAYFGFVGAKDHQAAFQSAVFPLLGCAGTFFAGWFSDRFLEGRRGPVMAAFLVGVALALVGLVEIGPIAAALGIAVLDLAVILIGVTGFLLYGSYSLVGGVVALDFGGRRTAGTAAGLLDGVGYIGASLAGSGVAWIVGEDGAWGKAFAIMAVLAIGGAGVCTRLWSLKPR